METEFCPSSTSNTDSFNEPCYLCGGPLINGKCPAYNWHDAVHKRNRARMAEGLAPETPEKLVVSASHNWGPCFVCGAATDPEGRCTRVNEFFHTDGPSAYGYVDAEWHYSGMFHTLEETDNAPPVTFLIKDFLQCEGVTAIAAPVRERKSLIALNIVHALCTGEKLFDYFEVVKKPKRVLYLCPEVSLGPFVDRLKKIGLRDYVRWKLFYRTMSSDGRLELSDPIFQEALPGSVVVLDTAIRFLEGDENSSADIRAFADTVFSLLKKGAESVILIHHSPKDSGDMMTLENSMRGSGDMGAFLACCWGTKLQDPANPYTSTSFLSNLKQRDFESKDFEVTCGPDCRMHIVADPNGLTVTLASRRNRSNKDGLDGKAVKFLEDNPAMSLRDTAIALKELGIKRGKDWVKDKRFEMLQRNGGKLPTKAV